MSLPAFFGMSRESISELADYLLRRAHRRPLLGWERNDKGYSSPTDRTLQDALSTLKYENCKVLESIKFKLQPHDSEIVAVITINLIDEDRQKARTIADNALKAVSWRYWVAFLEPTTDGLPHRTLLIRIPRRGLKRLEKHIEEEKADLGFSSSINLAICDRESWHSHQPGQWPWPLGYNSAGAYNLTYILSFTAWIEQNGGRWYAESRKCVRLESDEVPNGYVPRFNTPKNPLISKGDVSVNHSPPSPPQPPFDDPKLNTNDPRYYNLEWSNERRITRLKDELEEHEGRLLNDSLCTLAYAKTLHPRFPDLIDKSGLVNDELPQKYIDLISKAIESRDESVLVIAQNSLETEREAEIEKAQKPEKERQKRVKTVMAAYLRTSKSIRQKSRDKAIFAIAQEINNAVNSEDREALSKFGLTRRNALIFDLNEVKIISQDIMQKIDKYDGETEEEKTKIMREINNKLRPHLHCLMFAELHIFIQKFREKSQLFTGEKLKLADEILQKIDEKIGAHRKATCQGHWLKKALGKAMGGNLSRLREMLEEIDFRSDQTRAQHGRKPLKNGVVLVEDNSEVKARQKTKNIRKIELLKAAEAAEKSAQPRVRKPRQPRKKQGEIAH